MVPIRSRDEFIPAIRTKLLLEIANLQPNDLLPNDHLRTSPFGGLVKRPRRTSTRTGQTA